MVGGGGGTEFSRGENENLVEGKFSQVGQAGGRGRASISLSEFLASGWGGLILFLQ